MSMRLNSTAGLKLNVHFWHKADIQKFHFKKIFITKYYD